MDLLTYTKKFANELLTGAIYQKPLNPQEAVLHRSIGKLLHKAVESGAAMELAGDLLQELLNSLGELQKLKEAQPSLPLKPVPKQIRAKKKEKAPENVDK